MLKTRNGVTIGTEGGSAASSALRRFLRCSEVQRVTGLPQSSLYALISKDKFPKPFPLTENRVAWLEDDIAQWQAERLAAAQAGDLAQRHRGRRPAARRTKPVPIAGAKPVDQLDLEATRQVEREDTTPETK